VIKLAYRSAVLAFMAAIASVAASSAASARYEAVLPPCDDPGALHEIASRFAQKEAQFWNSDLQIVDFLRVRQVAFRPWAVHTIPRRFCTGQVIVSDGVRRRVNFSIIEDAGIIGSGWGVEWCVVGLDRNLAYAPACRAALP
jgi:hypothetical protein